MKVIRVPWIQCRADEVGAESFSWEWGGKDFEIMAFTRKEAAEWWSSLSDPYKGELLGLTARSASDSELSLF